MTYHFKQTPRCGGGAFVPNFDGKSSVAVGAKHPMDTSLGQLVCIAMLSSGQLRTYGALYGKSCVPLVLDVQGFSW